MVGTKTWTRGVACSCCYIPLFTCSCLKSPTWQYEQFSPHLPQLFDPVLHSGVHCELPRSCDCTLRTSELRCTWGPRCFGALGASPHQSLALKSLDTLRACYLSVLHPQASEPLCTRALGASLSSVPRRSRVRGPLCLSSLGASAPLAATEPRCTRCPRTPRCFSAPVPQNLAALTDLGAPMFRSPQCLRASVPSLLWRLCLH
ncbi:UNVERIFIED_CONTAM: hypothetical protein FKN15_004447 [Acipenser sinensis]